MVPSSATSERTSEDLAPAPIEDEDPDIAKDAEAEVWSETRGAKRVSLAELPSRAVLKLIREERLSEVV